MDLNRARRGLGGERGINRRMYVEVAVEARDLERPAHLDARAGQQEGASVVHVCPRLDEHAEQRRVHEADLLEVDYEPRAPTGNRGDQRLAHETGVVDVQFAVQTDEDGAVLLGDLAHWLLPKKA